MAEPLNPKTLLALENVSDSAGLTVEDRIWIDDLQYLVVGHVPVGFLRRALDEVSFESEVRSFVLDIHPLVVKAKNCHGSDSALGRFTHIDSSRVRRPSDSRERFMRIDASTPGVPLGPDPLQELSLPDGTEVTERDLVTDRDILVGGHSEIDFGLRGGSILIGERADIKGRIEAAGDCRIDMWTTVHSDVLVENDAYLGERVNIDGQLVVAGDLDIGDDVTIEEGFEANGWIVIRNPMPTVVFLFVYLTHLLRMSEDEAAELVSAFTDEDEEESGLVIPRGATITDEAWHVSTPATIGSDCRIHGNIRATTISIGPDSEVYGSLRAREGIDIADGATVHGDVTTRRGDVDLGTDVEVLGEVACSDLALGPGATVDGAVRSRGEVRIARQSPR